MLENAVEPAVSPDGSQIAFSRRVREGADLTIWVARLDDPGAARQLTPDGLGVWSHENPAFSPETEFWSSARVPSGLLSFSY